VIQHNCAFCEFDSRYIIAENAYVFALYFPRPIKKGHLVVALKAHKPTLVDIIDEEARELMSMALSVAKVAQELNGAAKYYLVAIGDSDLHYHLHLLPRNAGNPSMGRHVMLKDGWAGEVGETVTPEEMLEFVEAAREQLRLSQ
jgi:diadenosine tetraphosphate (Ap4A) HIT family hydrolase